VPGSQEPLRRSNTNGNSSLQAKGHEHVEKENGHEDEEEKEGIQQVD